MLYPNLAKRMTRYLGSNIYVNDFRVRKKGTKDLRMIKNNNFLATFIGRSLPVDMTKEYFEKIIGEEKKKKHNNAKISPFRNFIKRILSIHIFIFFFGPKKELKY